MKVMNLVKRGGQWMEDTAYELATKTSRAIAGKVVYVTAFVLVAMFAGSHVANATVTLPDTGIVFADLVNAAVLVIGGCVSAVVLAYFAFKAIKIGLRWSGVMGG